MAAREPRWFVYVLMDGAVPIYVGKGQGKRHLVSQSRHGGEVSILKRFHKESAALRYEREMIAKWRPQCNKTSGGEGRSRKPREPGPESIVNGWMREAIKRAKQTGDSFDRLVAACYIKCKTNSLKASANV